MAPAEAHTSAIPGAIIPKMGENLSEMWPNWHDKSHADWKSPSWEIRNHTLKKERHSKHRKGKEEYLYSAILADTLLTKCSDMDHTVLPANYTMSAFPL